MEGIEWIVWSKEHGGWWKPGRNGYTRSRAEAGRYSFAAAVDICLSANHALSDYEGPEETMEPVKRAAS